VRTCLPWTGASRSTDFQLNEQPVVQQKVGPEALAEDHAFETDVDRHLPIHLDAALPQASGENRLVHGLQQARPKPFMDLEAAVDGDASQLLDILGLAPHPPLLLRVFA